MKKLMSPAAAVASTVAGAALVGSLAAVDLANAGENPFAVKSLDSGYLQLASEGEGKCGGEKSGGEGKCGGEKSGGEGKCGGEKSGGEGKCGEGKCGGSS